MFGNKADKEAERKIPVKQVQDWLQKNNNIPYEETSALEGQNVEQAFTKIAHQLLKQALQQDNTIL